MESEQKNDDAILAKKVTFTSISLLMKHQQQQIKKNASVPFRLNMNLSNVNRIK